MSANNQSSASRRRVARDNSEGGEHYPQIFVKDGLPVQFYLMDHDDPRRISPDHKPLSPQNVDILTRDIENHGGAVCDSEADARVVIVNKKALGKYKQYYRLDQFVHAESPEFIRKSVIAEYYAHKRTEKKAMGGPMRPRKTPRREFTREEEEFLAQYLAIRIPEKDAGGRAGNGVYKELVAQGEAFPRGPWGVAQRHTWQSWREKYVKNQPRMDELIQAYVDGSAKPEDGKALYDLDRRLSARYKVAQELVDDTGSEQESVPARGQKRPARESVDSNASYRPPQKRARREEEEEEEEDRDSDELSGFELPASSKASTPRQQSVGQAGPSGTQRSYGRSPSTNRSASNAAARYTGEYSVTTYSPKRKRMQGHMPASSQATLVDPTQRPRAATTKRVESEPESEDEPIPESEPEPRKTRPKPRPVPSRVAQALHVEVVIPPRVKNAQSPRKAQPARQQSSVPPSEVIEITDSESSDDDREVKIEHSDDTMGEDDAVDDDAQSQGSSDQEEDELEDEDEDQGARDGPTTQDDFDAFPSAYDEEDEQDKVEQDEVAKAMSEPGSPTPVSESDAQALANAL
ncbi:hypothetical protein BDW22DRAFT_1353978 [Trametopsis cervina]|nr:hypothetical protein BDW22DRAFT_1353978 [Trametopsis cervina]